MSNSELMEWKIYKHTSPNGKVYIGQTHRRNVEDRWLDGYGYKHNKFFFSDIKKYGWCNFKHKIVKICYSQEEADYEEAKFIRNYRATNPKYGYNVSKGQGIKMTVEEKRNRKWEIENERYTRFLNKFTN